MSNFQMPLCANHFTTCDVKVPEIKMSVPFTYESSYPRHPLMNDVAFTMSYQK